MRRVLATLLLVTLTASIAFSQAIDLFGPEEAEVAETGQAAVVDGYRVAGRVVSVH